MHGWGSWRRDPAITEGERPVGATPREALPAEYAPGHRGAIWPDCRLQIIYYVLLLTTDLAAARPAPRRWVHRDAWVAGLP
jgi:hypothetical protein